MSEVISPSAVPLAALQPAPWNPRSIKSERFENLCASIQSDPDFLWRRPVLAIADGTIYAGNMRYRAAQHLGLETIPAIIEDIPLQLAKERALRDNGSWGQWDEDELASLLAELKEQESDLGLLGFEERDLQKLLDSLGRAGGLTDPDAIPEVPETPITQRGDLWLLGEHRVLCGDSTDPHDVTIVMNGEKAKLMATDPPYLVNYTGGNHPPSKANRPETRDKDWDAYTDPESGTEFFVKYLQAALPHLVDRAPIYQWHASNRQPLVDAAWRRAGLLPHQVLIWVKTRGVLTRSHFMWQHEPCMYGWVEGRMPQLKPPPSETTVWHVDQKGEQDGIHPTQKPVELFRRPLKFHTKPGELCFEPFLGSGTCLIAAEELGRRCYGIDQAPEYVDVVVKRWEQFTGNTAVRVPAGERDQDDGVAAAEAKLRAMGLGSVKL
ncbi:MAG TPA: DNA methyltransferase [Tepidiformaceae bacterium]|nr:DNA methyltransferase [Tepidiformaceae bacterium]